jgi:hypothetical protein
VYKLDFKEILVRYRKVVERRLVSEEKIYNLQTTKTFLG